jgi:hypothetical protein
MATGADGGKVGSTEPRSVPPFINREVGGQHAHYENVMPSPRPRRRGTSTPGSRPLGPRLSGDGSMSIRNIALVAASGLLLASPLAASAATTKAPATHATNPCKGMHGKALKTCKQNAKKGAK